MSKSGSGYFSGTSGEGKALIQEVKLRGDSISEKDVVGITKCSDGRIIWLEKGHLGDRPSGLAHILDAHQSNFNDRGIATEDIADFVLSAVAKGTVVGYQGKGTGRPIYEVTYNGKTQRVAVTVGSNGYIVGANPKKGDKGK